MPIFEYDCRRCNHRFETIVLSSREKIRCPKCESAAVEKRLSVFRAHGLRAGAEPSAGCGCTPETCGCH